MDYEAIWKRLNLQAVSKFLLYGDNANEAIMDYGTLQERLERYQENYSNQLKNFDDELTEKLILDIGSSEDVYFELGVMAGFILSKVFLR